MCAGAGNDALLLTAPCRACDSDRCRGPASFMERYDCTLVYERRLPVGACTLVRSDDRHWSLLDCALDYLECPGSCRPVLMNMTTSGDDGLGGDVLVRTNLCHSLLPKPLPGEVLYTPDVSVFKPPGWPATRHQVSYSTPHPRVAFVSCCCLGDSDAVRAVLQTAYRHHHDVVIVGAVGAASARLFADTLRRHEFQGLFRVVSLATSNPAHKLTQ